MTQKAPISENVLQMYKQRVLALVLFEGERCTNRLETGKRKSVWVHETLRKRRDFGEYHHLVQELRLDDVRFKAYFRMSWEQFDNLLSIVGLSITKMNTNYRESIGPAERLSICLRFLATGDSYKTIAFSYRVGRSTVMGIVKQVCEAIWLCLVEKYMQFPKMEEWMAIAEDYQKLWNFPNCVGAIDGKHVTIQAPANSGSQFHNYKGSFSIVLLAVVDARYRFRMIDVGAFGKSSDGGTLSSSAFGQAHRQDALDLPPDAPLPGAEGTMPFLFVADEAFPLQKNMMRPFPGHNLSPEQRIFNYRLSRARRMVECAFGILASQWRLYRQILAGSPQPEERQEEMV
nr:uncharacterized protein LOC129412676 [Misgurnus anguillicaudatus]